ncbi:nuclear transport factor 2 family protein [Rapidithrix thailandica]|uniref:Nuclear transport factor 2 family protein n=1 Tax=Rapidithrix thailandica TaxID=413964 RepID=A0AAW9RY49_9BACT
MMTYKEKANSIEKTLKAYFDGIYNGDVQKLKSTFTHNAYLYGDVKGEVAVKSVEDYLTGVENRKSPKDLGETFQMEILSIEILGKVAMAKLHVPMLGFNYYDLLSLSLVNGEWKIVNKLFTHVA